MGIGTLLLDVMVMSWKKHVQVEDQDEDDCRSEAERGHGQPLLELHDD